MNKKGMTLLELIVYIILASFLLAPVIFLVQRSSMDMARDNSSSILRSQGKDILNIIYDDFKNTGYKAQFDTSTGSFSIVSEVFYTSSDSSSFRHINGDPYDEIIIRKGVLDEDGEFTGIDTIRYNVDSEKILWRHDLSSGDSQKVAFDVEALQFQYADSYFSWVNNPTSSQKKLMKHIKVFLLLSDEKQLSVTGSESFEMADVTITYSDQSLRELYQVMIPIPNNGLFF